VNRSEFEDQRHFWVGLLVEPQLHLYTRLAKLHRYVPHWSFYNGAVVESAGNKTKDEIESLDTALCVDGTVQFCETKTPGVGDWTTQGQLNTVAKRACAGNQNMHVIQRPCVSSFSELLHHGSREFQQLVGGTNHRLDLLQIDVEGQDFEVMKLMLKNVRPLCVHYESFHLQEYEQQTVVFLEQQNYTVQKVTAMDTLACRVRARGTSM